ncbi:aromatic ring-hydroxylating oxygenase subunit alpha [Thermus thermophilus]|uniref:Rieske (2Fe-2S) domain-containing protein n=1 Tax=Thermus thermophilus JL-18 TaxID=798128 RepID=H9ZVA0_THETH|nr:aromatic ring-hydroxylating dioxygenase subunit alpha [Thermus thermophilus]AFH40260.1 Rieske (2Fe-2S) domain-containing protein [Thermus thermophilus JL-18]
MPILKEHLVLDDPERGVFRVHRSAFTSQEIFDLEREYIFGQCWLYLGHESEIPSPGDYVRRWIGGRPLFMVRDEDGQVRVFYNTCTHRGALVCRRDKGNAKVFQCFYHAWTFDTKGRLVGVPKEERFGPGFAKEELGLRSPRVGTYRGFVFVNFSTNPPPLEAYLAGAKEVLDLVADQAEEGMIVLEGSHRYAIRANWKLMVENSVDSYHVVPTHQTYLEYLEYVKSLRGEGGKHSSAKQMVRHEVGLVLGNGHAAFEYDAKPVGGRPVAEYHPLLGGEEVRQEIEEVKARLFARLGGERGLRIARRARNILLFPNAIIVDSRAVVLRTVEPISPDITAITQWELVPREELGTNRLKGRMAAYLSFFGPGGLATPDDVEAVESCQAGFAAGEVEYNDLSLGYAKEDSGVTELPMRVFWRQWYALIQGKPAPTSWEDPVAAR